jgi:hypothetical protein
VGYVELFVDGSTTQRPGTWPTLEFVLYTIPGQDNDIGMPIRLLPIDVTRGLFVDDTTGGTLTIPELPGFALTVAPGSAVFPGGGRTGTVSATLVHSDMVPMAPGFGQQPKFIVTVQPPGVHFEPPAPVTFPNIDGLAPGEVTEIYSFDHDLGQFVSIGTGTVSEDGSVVRSDPGAGLIKGGWHAQGNPQPFATTSRCGDCKRQQGSACVIDPNHNLLPCTDDRNPCTYDICVGGICTHQRGKLTGTLLSPSDNFKIQTDPRMPVVNSKVQVVGVVPDPTANARFLWETNVRYTARNQRVIEETLTPVTQGNTYSPTWVNIRGGDLTVSATLVRGVTSTACFKSVGKAKILGINPTQADIQGAIPDPIIMNIICHESSYRQFNTGGERAGLPNEMLEPDGRVGVGLMQITTPTPDDDDFWNWRANIASGVAIWNSKMAAAQAGIARIRRQHNDVPPALSADDMQREALRRYNGGRYWDWDPQSGQWYVLPPPPVGDPNYVNNVLGCN